MTIIIPANSAAVTAYDVANSCRFNDGDSPKLTITPGSAGNVDKWTLSMWIKRGSGTGNQTLFLAYTSSGNYTLIRFQGSGATFPSCILFENYVGAALKGQVKTNAAWRDTSAWYHFVFVWDSGNATAGNRMRIYANGAEVTSLGVDTNPDQNQDSHVCAAVEHTIGAGNSGGSEFFDGYMAEICLCDGQTLAASDFGEFDSDSPTIWKPKDVSGLTFGTNGFYLDFEDSANLGNDANGGTDLTEANLAAVDQATDTPTNNFCTMNPLDNHYADATFSQGNCHVVTSTSAYTYVITTMGVTAGKWYWEVEFDAKTHANDYSRIGFAGQSTPNATGTDLGTAAHGYGYYGYTGYVFHNTSNTDFGATYTVGDIISVALDLTNLKAYWGKNGTWLNSGDPTSGATGTGAVAVAAISTTPIGAYFPAIHFADSSNTGTFKCNFGGSPAFTVSSANADADGYGAFEYAVPSGYFALCTKNLAEYGG